MNKSSNYLWAHSWHCPVHLCPMEVNSRASALHMQQYLYRLKIYNRPILKKNNHNYRLEDPNFLKNRRSSSSDHPNCRFCNVYYRVHRCQKCFYHRKINNYYNSVEFLAHHCRHWLDLDI